ncbi:hypothetical protein OSH10_06190 [Kaistia defluvii]|uniref:hypothetical protein n=1 Tax=Kaistia defluvii TaxID=410841 RepID=UPI002254C274|nr:hypothetical protein [Kaistia defluvii]MCX5518019.1 hypothetical protein [Kaistia defluvii]
MDGPDHLGEPVRTALAAFCLAAMLALAFIITSQIGGLDRDELAGLMGPPASGSDPAETDADPFDGQPVNRDDPAGAVPPAPPSSGALPPQPGTVAETTPGLPLPAPAEPVARATRNVTAPGMTPAPSGSGPLEREALPKKAPTPPRWKAYAPVVVEEAGLLDIGPRKVRLAGINTPAADRLCSPPASDGTEARVACSHLALVALRRRIRAFGVECRISANETADPVVAPCRIGPTDLALWLVEQGWAQAAKQAPEGYVAAEKEARCARRGVWREVETPPDCLQN